MIVRKLMICLCEYPVTPNMQVSVTNQYIKQIYNIRNTGFRLIINLFVVNNFCLTTLIVLIKNFVFSIKISRQYHTLITVN